METPASAIETVALDQRRWSLTANKLKDAIHRARLLTFGLAVAGAVLETAAAQLFAHHLRGSQVAGYMGAAALACVVVIKAQSLTREQLQGWILARAASEAFKREMYRYRTSSGPYANAGTQSPEATLFLRRDEILSKVSMAQKFVLEPAIKVVAGGPLDANAYIAERIDGPIGWFRGRADESSAAQSKWNILEYILAITGALLGAALTVTHKQAFGSWVAVITTVSGVVTAHVMAERYNQTTISYRSTADRLTGILGRWRAMRGPFGDLVEQVEATLMEENRAWIAAGDELIKELLTPPDQSEPKTA